MRRQKIVFSGILIVLLLSLVMFLSLSFRPVEAAARYITLKPTDDTYVAQEAPSSNYGSQTCLMTAVGGKPRPPPTFFWDVVWLKFNLSSISDSAVITNATLSLYASEIDVGFLYPIDAHSCSNTSWSESTLTYSNQPSYNGTSMDAVQVGTHNQWYSWNVVDATRSALSNNSEVVTIVLFMNTTNQIVFGANFAYFTSKEALVNQTDYSPRLTISWDDQIIPGDCNQDGTVNMTDVDIVRTAWQSKTGESNFNFSADVNMDGMINIKDAAIIGVNWGKHA